ncbi:hypothetical protein [Sphingopyxis fribergensis]|uniref:hypothetical protein n=1 Tax=Sphingopyxis fribergensis TaxID=1515612 RepID=UPI0011DCE196|nr:hypothetical protein [Sphingopyxis fribergensis]
MVAIGDDMGVGGVHRRGGFRHGPARLIGSARGAGVIPGELGGIPPARQLAASRSSAIGGRGEFVQVRRCGNDVFGIDA